MIFELIAVIVAGVAGFGAAALVNRVVGGRLPRWLMPVAAGGAMLAVAISNEYSWYPRTAMTLPERLEVAYTVENRSFFRPWTYAVPFVDRFLAVDRSTLQTHEGAPGHRMVDIYAFRRWTAPQKMGVVFDCPGGRSAPVGSAATFAADGTIGGLVWDDVGADDPVLRTACGV